MWGIHSERWGDERAAWEWLQGQASSLDQKKDSGGPHLEAGFQEIQADSSGALLAEAVSDGEFVNWNMRGLPWGRRRILSNSLKKKKNERKSLVGGTIQIRGPLLLILERQELHTLGSQSREEVGQGWRKTPALSPL